MRNYYTDKEVKTMLKSMIILVDTREQQNSHIKAFLDKKKVKYKSKKLDFGDYSFYLPADEELDIRRDVYFDKEIVIERKGSLSELAGNLTKDRERFEKELIRKKEAKLHLMIENGSWLNINSGLYRSEYKPASFLATLYAYMARFNVSVDFINQELSGQFIYSTFYYYLREKLKDFSPIEEIA